MYIATVIPIKKGLRKENLSYFSQSTIPLGSIVDVPIRLKTIQAIVIDIEEARNVKSDLKSADFQLKKVIDVKGFSPFTKDFFTACERMKNYTVSSTGMLIKNLLPKVFLENISELDDPILFEHKDNSENPTENLKHEKLIFQANEEDRIGFYRTLIREAFAKKESIFIVVPTRYDIETYKEALTRGISDYVYSFHSEMPKKSLIANYNKAVTNLHPILIIGTGIFLSVPRHDIKTIIIEHESSDAYKQQSRPYLDIRSFAEVLSSVNKIKLIFSDTLLRPDTLHRHEIGELGEVYPPSFRLGEVERKIVVDMKAEVTPRDKNKPFSVFSEKTRALIAYALEKKESIFLYSLRKGLAPVTVCHDCGHTLLCPDCSTPIVLYSKNENRIFMCNKCGRKDTTEVRCPSCSSWNLTPLGVGTDRVAAEVRSLFPDAKIIQIDREVTPTDGDAKKAVTQCNKNSEDSGSILIGTEMAFSYLHADVDHSAIISLDGLLSIPSFNITQKILHTIEKLHHITKKNLIIQTRLADNTVLEHVLSGNVLPLYREDLKERKQYGYPPFVRLIKITFAGSKSETEYARKFLDETLADYDPQIFSAFISKIRNQYITNTIIKINPSLWPLPTKETNISSPDLLHKLYSLPPAFSINVDPEDLL
jgi:primosomal protein N' (replication factor Y)